MLRQLKSKLFSKYLWFTNTASCGGLLAIGDCIQQHVEHFHGINKIKEYDWQRTGRLFLVGLSQGPPHHIFYLWLDKKLPQRNAKSIVKKVLCDQFIAAPFFAVTFFMAAGLLERKKIEEAWKECKSKFLAVYADQHIWVEDELQESQNLGQIKDL